MSRCVNLDWLEVHCAEPLREPRTAEHFAARGYSVNVREYGTPVYNEMFTLLDNHGNPMIEVRRSPKSQLMAPNMCHLRFHNSYCYYDDAADLMAQFIEREGFEFIRISRVDVCMDFEKFDSGDDPQAFLYRYIERKYSKINQSDLTSHGKDTWTAREWNSLSWGASDSDVGTKFYNKTIELYDPVMQAYKKPWIRYAWLKAGLIDDWQKVTRSREDGTIYTPQIWRVEFSIRSSRKRWFEIELDGHQRTKKGKQKYVQSLPNTLDVWKRENLVVMFASLAQHYFHFKYFKEDVRKDRCPDKILFRWKKAEPVYKFGNEQLIAATKLDKPLMSLITKLRAYRNSHSAEEIRSACNVLLKCMEGEQLRHELNYPFRSEELLVLRQTLSMKAAGSRRDCVVLMNEIRELLKLNDKTIQPF